MITKTKSKAVSGVYWVTLSSILGTVLKLISTMVLSRLLIPEDFGLVAALMVVISFAEIFWMLGVNKAIIQKKELTEIDIKTGNFLNICFGLIIYGLIFAFSAPIAEFVNIDKIIMLRILSLVFIIHSFSGVSEAVLQRKMNFKYTSFATFISLIIYTSVAIVLAILNDKFNLFVYGAWVLIIAYMSQTIIRTIMIIIKRPIKLTFKINHQSVKSLLYFGTGVTITNIINNMATQGDYFVVSRTLGPSPLGAYNRAYQLLLLPTNLVSSNLDRVLFPLLSKFQTNKDKIAKTFLNMIALLAVVAFPISFFSSILGAELVTVVLGPNWEATIIPFQILIATLFFRMTNKICHTTLRSIGIVYKKIWIQIVYATLIIGGAFIGQKWGIIGVAISTSIAIVIDFLILTVFSKYYLKYHIKNLFKHIYPIFIINLIVGLIIYFGHLLLINHLHPILILIILFIIAVIAEILLIKYVVLRFTPYSFNEFLYSIAETNISFISKKRWQEKLKKMAISYLGIKNKPLE
jgi:O-antigen/teichoic acid export membrane protein